MAQVLVLLGHEVHSLRLAGVSIWQKLSICTRHSLFDKGIALANELASELTEGAEATAVNGDCELSEKKAKLVECCLELGHGATKAALANDSSKWDYATQAYRLAARLDPSAYRYLGAATLLASGKDAHQPLAALHASIATDNSMRRQANWISTLLSACPAAGNDPVVKPALIPSPSLCDIPLLRFTSPRH